eukprot:gene10468-biopygen8360
MMDGIAVHPEKWWVVWQGSARHHSTAYGSTAAHHPPLLWLHCYTIHHFYVCTATPYTTSMCALLHHTPLLCVHCYTIHHFYGCTVT